MVNLIIKNGNNFVLNGNELLQTENPVLEVPDILNSEEVREKIAEDVQVGDVLFKRFKGYDPVNAIQPQGGTALTSDFFVYKDELYLTYCGSPVNPALFVYRNDEWQQIIGFDWKDTDYITGHDYPTLIELNGDLYCITGNYQYYPGFNILKLEGNRWTNITRLSEPILDYKWRSNSATYNMQIDNTEADALVIDGKIHILVTIYPQDYVSADDAGGPMIRTLVYDPSTELTSPVDREDSFEVSGSYRREVNPAMFNYDGSSFFKVEVANYGNWLYTYNSSTSGWEYVRALTYGDFRSVVESNGSVKGSISLGRIAVFNPSSLDFDVELTHPFGSWVPFISDETGDYILQASSLTYSQVSGTGYSRDYLKAYKYNTQTSSWDDYGSLPHKYSKSTLTTSSTAYNPAGGIKLIRYGDKIHARSSRWEGNGEGADIFTKDVSSQGDWDRFIWKDPGHQQENYGMASVEFSGSRFLYIVGRGNELFEYEPSSDSFRKTRDNDISPGMGRWGAAYVEDDTLKVMVHVGTPTIQIYHYNQEHDQLLKIATPSGIPTSNGFFETHELVSVSSGHYLLWLTNNVSPYLELYKVGDEEFTQLPSPSAFTFNDRSRLNAIGYKDKIFISTYRSESATSTDPGVHCYDITTSSWSPVNTVSSILHGNDFSAAPTLQQEEAIFFIYEDELYKIKNSWANYYGAIVSKYNEDLSGFVEDHQIFNRFNYFCLRTDIKVIDGTPILYNRHDNYYNPNNVACVYRGNGVWDVYKVFTQGTDTANRPSHIFKTVNGHCILTANQNFHGVARIDFSEFAGEHIWEKNVYISDRYGNDPVAYGVALESGSKGDTIRIQKVKR